MTESRPMTMKEPDLFSESEFSDNRLDEQLQSEIEENETRETWDYGALLETEAR